MDMAVTYAENRPAAGRRWWDTMERLLPKLVLAPTTVAGLVFIYGFVLWTAWISFTRSSLLPKYDLAGFHQYLKLFTSERWWVASKNLLIFGTLFVTICIVIGLLLAILLDQRIRIEGALRTIYLYPMALSFIVTGTAWKWILNPGLGLERLVAMLGAGQSLAPAGLDAYLVAVGEAPMANSALAVKFMTT